MGQQANNQGVPTSKDSSHLDAAGRPGAPTVQAPASHAPSPPPLQWYTERSAAWLASPIHGLSQKGGSQINFVEKKKKNRPPCFPLAPHHHTPLPRSPVAVGPGITKSAGMRPTRFTVSTNKDQPLEKMVSRPGKEIERVTNQQRTKMQPSDSHQPRPEAPAQRYRQPKGACDQLMGGADT